MTTASARSTPNNTAAVAGTLWALSAAGASGIIAASLAAYPDGTDGWLHAARYTARFAFLVFVPVFVARPWHQLWPSAASRWALKNRRALGISFAIAHFIHLYALTRFRVATAEAPDLATLVVGGGAYVMLTAMVATSNDAAVRALGARNWKRLHTVGIYWLWFVFFQSYAKRFASGQYFLLPFALVAFLALVVRIAARVRRGRLRERSRTPVLDV
jgi:DMSO/TMAO reductase YedYZ heme-binding membrane subunit